MDVTKTFQNCERLALLVYHETDRIMRNVFLVEHYLPSLAEETLDILVHDESSLALSIAEEYSVFLENEVKTSTDWVCRYIANYIILTRKYDLFQIAEKHGDAPMLEKHTSELLPAFKMTGKTNYLQTNTRLLECQYNAPSHVLQQLRTNRTRRQRDVEDSDGIQLPNKGLDDHMERLMPNMKQISHDGSYEA